MTGRRGRRGKQLLDGLQEKRGCLNLKDEALDRAVCGTGFGRGCGPVVRQTADWLRKYERVINHWTLIHWPDHNDKCRLRNRSLYCALSGKGVTVKASLIEK